MCTGRTWVDAITRAYGVSTREGERRRWLAAFAVAAFGCNGGHAAPTRADVDATAPDGGREAAASDGASPTGSDANTTTAQGDAAPPGSFCALPGSVIWTAQGSMTVPGGDAGAQDLSWLHLPAGFCAHPFATVRMVRQLRFAPGGELFASSPTSTTTGGANNGVAGIVILPDDNRDGIADQNIAFLSGLPSVQGLLFANGSFYYQDGPLIRQLAYQSGQRQANGPGAVAIDMRSIQQDSLHWPKVLDVAQDGTLYVTNGGSQSDACLSTWPVRGAVFRANPDQTVTPVAIGFRNPIAMRCERNHDVCLVVELALDYSGDEGGREKLVPLRSGDNWGFPCCATQGLAYPNTTYTDTSAPPDCSTVAADTNSFIIGHTPFGVDFETGQWPAPWTGRAFVTLHGVVGTWEGARVVAIALDPTTGLPLPATELDGGRNDDPNDMLDFATGWDDGMNDHGRPAPIAFAPDGRLFLGDDQQGAIVWIAPVGLMMP